VDVLEEYRPFVFLEWSFHMGMNW